MKLLKRVFCPVCLVCWCALTPPISLQMLYIWRLPKRLWLNCCQPDRIAATAPGHGVHRHTHGVHRHTQITLFMQLLSYAIHHTPLSKGLAPVEESQHLLLHCEVGHSALWLQQCQLCGCWLPLDIFNVTFHWSACIKSIFKEKYQTCSLMIKLVLKFLVTLKYFFNLTFHCSAFIKTLNKYRMCSLGIRVLLKFFRQSHPEITDWQGI